MLNSCKTAPDSSLQDKQITSAYIATILYAGLRSEGHSFELVNWSKKMLTNQWVFQVCLTDLISEKSWIAQHCGLHQNSTPRKDILKSESSSDTEAGGQIDCMQLAWV